MAESRQLLDDIAKAASEAGSRILRAGEGALDRFDTWRLEQELRLSYADLGRRVHQHIAASPHELLGDPSLDPELAGIIERISALKEEIDIRKNTLRVSERWKKEK